MGGYEPTVFLTIGMFSILEGVALLAMRFNMAACVCLIIGTLSIASVPYWAEVVRDDTGSIEDHSR